MGRKRKHNTHLPPRMILNHGAYYYGVQLPGGKKKWLPLGRDYSAALIEWARLSGSEAKPVTTVADMLAVYITAKRQTLSPRTIKGYEAQARTLCKPFGTMSPQDLTRADIYQYLTHRGNVAGNRERDLLRAAYNHAANIGAYEGPNPALGMRVRNAEAPRDRYVTDAELEQLLAAAQPEFADLLLFLYLTGMRISDALALQLTDAHPDGIHWQEQKKRGKPRHITWSPALQAVWKRAARDRIGRQHLFLGRRGPYTLHGFESTFARVRKRAGIQDIRPNDLRAKAASDLSLERARELLGHSNTKVTARHYRRKADPTAPLK